jgi:hypothetical protein
MLWPVKTGSKRWSGITLLCILFLSGDAAAATEGTEVDGELKRWVPSIALISGVGAQNAQGTITTTDVVGDPITAPLPILPAATPQPIVPGTPMTARTRMMAPYVGGSFELMAPAWFDIATSPRLYAHVDVSYAFGPVYYIPKIGDPGPFVGPTNIANFTTTSIRGQGATLSAEVDPLLVMAGFGFAFTFEAGERTFRVKPSFEYVRESIQINGLVRRAVGPNSANGGATNVAAFRPITLSIDETLVYNGLGAGLELELDTMRAGPLMLTLFANGKGWNFLDNQLYTFESSNVYGEGAFFQFLKNEWAFAGSIGLRFRWAPE